MGSNNTIKDFSLGDEVFYVPKILHPPEGESPLFKNCKLGKVTGIQYPLVMVKFKSKTVFGNDGKKYEGNYSLSKGIAPEDLWK